MIATTINAIAMLMPSFTIRSLNNLSSPFLTYHTMIAQFDDLSSSKLLESLEFFCKKISNLCNGVSIHVSFDDLVEWLGVGVVHIELERTRHMLYPSKSYQCIFF